MNAELEEFAKSIKEEKLKTSIRLDISYLLERFKEIINSSCFKILSLCFLGLLGIIFLIPILMFVVWAGVGLTVGIFSLFHITL